MFLDKYLTESKDKYYINGQEVILEKNEFDNDADNTAKNSKKPETRNDLYRFTHDGTGIYNAYRKAVSESDWKSFLNSSATKWLPDPPSYDKGYKSYFKKAGYEKFKQKTLPTFTKAISPDKIMVTEYDTVTGRIFYEDEYQIVFADTDKTEIERRYKINNESFIFSDDDIVSNLDKWKPKKGHNILYVTGLSGSGKTTIAEEYGKKYNAEVISMDWLLNILFSAIIPNTKMEKALDAKYRFALYGTSNDKDSLDFTLNFAGNELLEWINQYIYDSMPSNKLYVVEGIYIYNSTADFTDKPIIVKRTAMLKSLVRRRGRDGGFNMSSWSELNAIYFNSEKKMNEFIAKNKLIDNITNESFIFSDDDIVSNLDKWKKEHNSNILYITGMSGSGKTTIAKEYADKHNATLIMSDILVVRIMKHQPLKDGEYIPFEKEIRDYYGDTKWEGYESKSFIENLTNIITKYIKLMQNDYTKLYVFEGVWIFDIFDPEHFKNTPFILKGTSLLKSVVRRIKRDGTSISNIAYMIKYYKQDQRSVSNWQQYFNNI